jgi:N-methylhydantoinase A/oxoprolinase/acetone carboxylase beta subunit
MRLGLDTGGTFTDLVILGAGEGRVHKVPSSPTERTPGKVTILGAFKRRREPGQKIVSILKAINTR